eukprot:5911181-Pyramimonas_sp.AAC.1
MLETIPRPHFASAPSYPTNPASSFLGALYRSHALPLHPGRLASWVFLKPSYALARWAAAALPPTKLRRRRGAAHARP